MKKDKIGDGQDGLIPLHSIAPLPDDRYPLYRAKEAIGLVGARWSGAE